MPQARGWRPWTLGNCMEVVAACQASRPQSLLGAISVLSSNVDNTETPTSKEIHPRSHRAHSPLWGHPVVTVSTTLCGHSVCTSSCARCWLASFSRLRVPRAIRGRSRPTRPLLHHIHYFSLLTCSPVSVCFVLLCVCVCFISLKKKSGRIICLKGRVIERSRTCWFLPHMVMTTDWSRELRPGLPRG